MQKMRLEIIENDQIHFTWYLSKCGLFDDRDMDGLEVLDDFKMLNINMVRVITMQVDITMEEVKKEEFTRLKWI